MVASAGSDDFLGVARGLELQEFVEGSSQFERASGLFIFQLEIDFIAILGAIIKVQFTLHLGYKVECWGINLTVLREI
jgi:hypothetical protein